MPYKSLQHFIHVLEKAGELRRIKAYVNPHLEIPEITDRISKANGPALLFENTGYNFPLLINAMGSEKRMAIALGVKRFDDVASDIQKIFQKLTSPKNSLIEKLKFLPQFKAIASWMPKVVSGKGICQEVIMKDPDITKFPILKCWPEDGGSFLTLPIIHTKDPNTGIRNVGLYRMQVFGTKLTAMHWHKHKVSARHFNEYKKLGIKMPVAVALGGDPVYTYCATAPLPDGVDEYLLAGFIRKKRVELVQCLTQDAQVPADADIIIEGYIDPSEDYILEGPFGDHTGYYSLADYYPKFHITAITHRRDAVYPATIVGIPPQEDAWIGKATERIFLAPIKMTMVPEILDMTLPIEGVFHNLLVVKIKKEFPGQAIKVMHSLWGAGQMMFTKIMIVVDEFVDIHNNLELAKYVSDNINPESDIIFTKGPMDVLDHACSTMAFGGKMGMDATKKFSEEGLMNILNDKANRINKENIIKRFEEIKFINDSLYNLGISIILIAVKKNRKNHISEINQKLFDSGELQNVKIVIYLDHTINVSDIANAIWRFSSNIDPLRDHILTKDKDIPRIAFDATRKTKELDGFQRDWPNILVSNDETIKRIDEIWDKLDLGPFIKSPSLKYKMEIDNKGAIFQERNLSAAKVN